MKIIICGYKGKMGSLIYKQLKNVDSIDIVDLVDLNTQPLESVINKHEVDAVIDFTNAKTCLKHANLCLINNVNFISGKTGLTKEELKYIDKCAKEKSLSFVISPNFSIGINAMLKTLPILGHCFKNIEIEEQHHISKLDSPSGTALTIKKQLNKENIKIKSIRNESKIMYHKVMFKNKNESIIITHKTTSRKAYIDGVLYSLYKVGTFKGLKKTINF